MLFTLGALKKIQTGCLLIVSDVVVEGEFKRITDEDMRAAVDQMTELALVTVTDEPLARGRLPRQPGVGRRDDRPALAGARTAAPATLGLEGDALFSERPEHLRELARGRRPRTAPRSSSPSAATAR